MTTLYSEDSLNSVLKKATVEYERLDVKNNELLSRFGLSAEKLSADALKAITDIVKCQQICEITDMNKNRFLLWYAQKLEFDSKVNWAMLELNDQIKNIENLTNLQKKTNTRLERELQNSDNISDKQGVITELALIESKINTIAQSTQHFKEYLELEQNLTADDLVDDLNKLKIDIEKLKKENGNLKLVASFKI